MQFSIKQLGLLVGWLAILLGLIVLIKIESQREQWTSQVPSGVLLVVNVGLSLFAVLTAVGLKQRSFWLGFSIVAVTLSMLQIFEIRPTGIGANAAFMIHAILTPDQALSEMFRAGHVTQLEVILIYGWTPVLSYAGGWYLQRLVEKDPNRNQN